MYNFLFVLLHKTRGLTAALLVAVVPAVVLVVALEGERDARARDHAAELVGRVAGGGGCGDECTVEVLTSTRPRPPPTPVGDVEGGGATYDTPARRSCLRSRCRCRTSRCC